MNELRHPQTTPRLLDQASQAMQPPRILLAEDDPSMRRLLREVLEEDGYEVVLAEDGFGLLDQAEATWSGEDEFDLVCSDIRMPGCTGLDALSVLRSRNWSVPILFMTAFGSEGTHREAARLGASVIDKPFALKDLLARIHGVVPPTRYSTGWQN